MIGWIGRPRLTGSVLSSRVAQWGQRSLIKSVQRGTVTLTIGQTSNTATITSVIPANCVIRYGGLTQSQVNPNWGLGFGLIDLTNATTVTATISTAVAAATVYSFDVVEYQPGVLRSVQRGTITIGAAATSNTATITAVDVTKAELGWLGWTLSIGVADTTEATNIVLTNATTVTATRVSNGAYTAIAGYQVAEFF